MPPRRKRGSSNASTRGRRGRPATKKSIKEPEPVVVLGDDSNKSSDAETTKPIETKIHKKFGKYQVPDVEPQIVPVPSPATLQINDPVVYNEILSDVPLVVEQEASNELETENNDNNEQGLSHKMKQLDVQENSSEAMEVEESMPVEENILDVLPEKNCAVDANNDASSVNILEEPFIKLEITNDAQDIDFEEKKDEKIPIKEEESLDETFEMAVKSEPIKEETKSGTEEVVTCKEVKKTETSEEIQENVKLKTETKKSKKSTKTPKVPKQHQKSKKEEKSGKKESSKGRKGESKKKQAAENDEETNIRRSSRIKSISTQKVRSKGKGLVRKDIDMHENNSNSSHSDDKSMPPPNFATPAAVNSGDSKPVKVKSRWRRSSELEMNSGQSKSSSQSLVENLEPIPEKKKGRDEEVEKRLKQFIHLKENQYLTERISCKEAKKMICDCFLTQEEIDQGEYGCGDDCLNRLLMIECGNLCTVGDRCTNKRFQKGRHAPCEVFNTEHKGLGIRATANIPSGEFILEYVGEVLDPDEFESRATEYSKDKNQHYYFMSLRADAVIDATCKGNVSRFINHSCDPNAETQKWTVNGELRIGFFSKRTILAGEEITFDYQFQRYGKEAQKCLCGTSLCRGWLGEEPDEDDYEDEDEEDEEEEEEEEEVTSEAKEVSKDTKAEVVKKVVKKEKKVSKKEKKPRLPKPIRKVRKEKIFEDSSIDDEINSLETTGLKNQFQTLKFSRLMVRAKELTQRTRLLQLLKNGEFPCRRLFLDYHGLRLLHGWMTDAVHVKEKTKMENLRHLILQTLAVLPIPNKTMLQDSKVLSTVENWSKNKKPGDSPENSESNSPEAAESEEKPSIDLDEKKTLAPLIIDENEESERKSVGYEVLYRQVLPNFPDKSIKEELLILFDDDFVPLEVPMIKQTAEMKQLELVKEIVNLALKLLEEWSSLKEVFRIPKKERIEQMKEHEREADRRYKALCDQESVDRSRRESRYRNSQRTNRIEPTTLHKDRKHERNVHVTRHMSKHERRKLFAMQVEQAEEEKRRKQQELWRQNYLMMGADPRLAAGFADNPMHPFIWNPQIGQWQNVPGSEQFPGVPFNLARNPEGLPQGLLPPNVIPPTMPPASMGTMPPMPNIPAKPSVPYQEEDPSKVKFLGPIPPPVALPPKWKCAKDKYGRPYYYHVKIRKSQWEPPPFPVKEEEEEASDSSSSSDTSSLSSESSSEDSDSDDIDDTRLMLEIRNKFKRIEAQKQASLLKKEQVDAIISQPSLKHLDPVLTEESVTEQPLVEVNIEGLESLVPVENAEVPPTKKRRVGLVQEHIISPRSDDSKQQFKEDIRKYKQNKEMVRKQKVMILQQAKKHAKPVQTVEKPRPDRTDKKLSVKHKLREMEANCEDSKKIKEVFRSQMAGVMVGILNHYRKSDCKEGRITSTEDFKHLARKLTHFVMLKELKHCDKIENLQCTENVKMKAKEFVKKYMSKFGEVYQRQPDEAEY